MGLVKIAKKPTKLLVPTPNLSVMLPGSCNAKCEFCFWNRDQEANKFPMMEFGERLASILDALPKEFSQISVTGGEPTISPVLEDVMEVLAKRKKRFPKVVLTTNAVRLKKQEGVLSGVVKHINISRHHFDDTKNREIFKSKSVPSTKELRGLVEDIKWADICFNCVVPPDVSVKFCKEFIRYADAFENLAAINFRIYHDSMEDCRTMKEFERDWGGGDVSTCPVCKVVRMLVGGTQVNWKYSVMEPTQHWEGIYELVVQPDGRLTADWAGLLDVKPEEIQGGVMAKSNRELAEELIELAKRLLDERRPRKVTKKPSKGHQGISSYSGGSCHSPSGGRCH